MSKILLLVLVASAMYAEETQYYCYDAKKDIYNYVDPGDKESCAESGGKFDTFNRKKFRWFCRYSDGGFLIGTKTSKKKAEALCESGKIEKAK